METDQIAQQPLTNPLEAASKYLPIKTSTSPETYAYTSLGDTVIIRLLDVLRSTDNEQFRKQIRGRTHSGNDPFKQGMEEIFQAVMAVQSYLVVTDDTDCQAQASEHLKQAEAVFNNKGAKNPLVSAIDAFRQDIQDFDGLLRPTGQNINCEPFVKLVKKRIEVFQYLQTKAPCILDQRFKTFRDQVQPQFTALLKKCQQLEAKNEVPIEEAKQFLNSIERIHENWLQFEENLINDNNYQEGIWEATSNLVLTNGLSEAHRFLRITQAHSLNISLEEMATLALSVIGPVDTLLEDLRTSRGDVANLIEEAFADIRACLNDWQSIQHLDEHPASLGNWWFWLDNQINASLTDLKEMIPSLLLNDPRDPLVGKIVGVSKEITARLQALAADPAPQLHLERQARRVVLKKIGPKPRKKKRTKKIKNSSTPSGKQEVERAPRPLEVLITQVYGLDRVSLTSPESDGDFRREWRTRGEASLKVALRHLSALSERELSWQSAWTTLYQLHQALEAVLDWLLAHYPIKADANLALGERQKTHHLNKLLGPLLKDTSNIPDNVKELLNQNKQLIEELSQAAMSTLYPAEVATTLKGPYHQPLLEFISQLKNNITLELQQTLLNRWFHPTLTFISQLIAALTKEPMAEDIQALVWAVQPIAQATQEREQRKTASACQVLISKLGKQSDLVERALNHSEIYLRRVADTLSAAELCGSDLLVLLDLTHQLLREVYVAAIGAKQGGKEQLFAQDPGEARRLLRFEHNLALLSQALNLQGINDPSAVWPYNAHYLMRYSFALKRTGQSPSEGDEATFCDNLRTIYGKGWKGDAEISENILNTYIGPSLEMAYQLLKQFPS